MKTIRLKKGKEESLQRFHPWIFSGAIASIEDGITEGDTVRVTDARGDTLGCGHYQPGTIAVRMLTLDGTCPVPDGDFFGSRLLNALQMRRALGLLRPDNTACRLVHGEGDNLPGLIVDLYGDTAVMQAHTAGMHRARNIIADALVSLPDTPILNVYYKSETTLPYKADLGAENDYLIKNGAPDAIALENGLKFRIDWLKGQKTGFFVDQRDNRMLLRTLSAGRRVLNMFCYTGGFSVAALAGGAANVVSVDSSAKAVSLTDANVALNFPDETRHTSVAEDAFKFLEHTPAGEYDLMVLDPPAFAKHRGAVRNALRGYQRLNALGLSKIARGGLLFTFSCSQAISREQFRLAVLSAAVQTRRNVRILHQLTQPADHPVNIYHPEGEYLKGLVLYVD